MAAICHFELVLSPLNHPRRVVVGHYDCVKFVWIQQFDVQDMRVSVLSDFGLKMFIHAPLWVFWG